MLKHLRMMSALSHFCSQDHLLVVELLDSLSLSSYPCDQCIKSCDVMLRLADVITHFFKGS